MRHFVPSMPRRISSKIVVPYMALALLVALAGSFVASLALAGSTEQRLEQSLRQSLRLTSDGASQREQILLDRLRLIALSSPNPSEGLPGTAEALASGQHAGLDTLLGLATSYYDLSQLVAVDPQGLVVAEGGAAGAPSRIGSSLANLPGVRAVLAGQTRQVNGVASDKFAGLTRDPAGVASQLYMAVPLRQRTAGGRDRLVGALVSFEPLETLVGQLHGQNISLYTAMYGLDGQLLASSAPDAGQVLGLTGARLADIQAQVSQGRALRVFQDPARQLAFAYAPLVLGGQQVGLIGVGIDATPLTGGWLITRATISAATVALLLAVAALGLAISRRITRPLRELTSTAEALALGNLDRRSTVTTQDEIGTLAAVLNMMTDRMLDLFHTSRRMASDLSLAGIARSTEAAVQSLLPSVSTALAVEGEEGWSLIGPEDEPRPLAALPQEAIAQLTPFSDLHDSPGLDQLRAVAPQMRWALPLRLLQQTPGLLLISEVSHAQLQTVGAPLSIVAAMVATALRNARLYARVVQQAGESQAVLHSIADGVVVCDRTGTIVQVNPAAARMLGHAADQLVGVPLTELPFTTPRPQDLLGLLSGDDLMTSQDRILSVSRSAIAGSSAALQGEVLVLRDVTAQRELDRAKSDFVSTISHELRTPLTPIQGYLDLLTEPVIAGELSPIQREFVATIHTNVATLSRLVRHVTLLTSLEAGERQPACQPIGVAAALDQAAAQILDQAIERGLDLTLEVPAGMPLVSADPELVQTLLGLLLDNALRYTPSGLITLSAEHHAAEVWLSVADTGPGIPAEEQERLFERFSRGGEQRGLVATERGAGLGLALARRLATVQQGRIWVESQPGQGSIFRFSLPVASTHDRTTAASAAIATPA